MRMTLPLVPRLAVMNISFSNSECPLVATSRFLWHRAQAFKQNILVIAYLREEEAFLKYVQSAPRNSVDPTETVVLSSVLYRVKPNDDLSLLLRARIGPHCNEDSQKADMQPVYCMCPTLGIIVVISTAAVRKLRFVKIDVKSAFLHTGFTHKNVYVLLSHKSKFRNELWLLMLVAYGLINANTKWKVQSDTVLLSLALVTFSAIPQLFVKKNDSGAVVLIIIKNSRRSTCHWF